MEESDVCREGGHDLPLRRLHRLSLRPSSTQQVAYIISGKHPQQLPIKKKTMPEVLDIPQIGAAVEHPPLPQRPSVPPTGGLILFCADKPAVVNASLARLRVYAGQRLGLRRAALS
jgi:hypothetical protein